jgi:hypothetical protein
MGVRIIKAADFERRQRRIIILLLGIIICGFVYFIYDDYQNSSIERLPENPLYIDRYFKQWRAEGFVLYFNIPQSIVIVNEEIWKEKKRNEKLDFVTQIARYFAKKNRSNQWTLQVLNQQRKVLAEINKSKFRVE